ncbi:hypothetical protein V8G54_003393 [Vigna mungo]|uniref:Uncharacterized protein n=1 Tax=Vigna mungo TaxID=3915 RepID=A0AAQ3SA39_VIGMU
MASNGEVGDVICFFSVDRGRGGIGVYGSGGVGGSGSGGGGGIVIFVVVVIVGVRGCDVDARKAFQGREEGGRDGGAEPHGHLIDLPIGSVVVHRRRRIRSQFPSFCLFFLFSLSFLQGTVFWF